MKPKVLQDSDFRDWIDREQVDTTLLTEEELIDLVWDYEEEIYVREVIREYMGEVQHA